MFKRKSKVQDETKSPKDPKSRRRKWLVLSIIGNILLVSGVAIASGTAVVVHESDTNPNFCGTCHLMQSHVTSYLEGNNLDHVHAEAGVECKDCHDYPLEEEIKAGIDYLTGNYEVDETGELPKRDFGDQICTKCHISLEHVATLTDYLYFNPHGTRMGTFTCNTCHLSHSEQIDYCNECHEAPGQRILGDDTPHEQIGKPVSKYGGMYGS